MAKVTQSVASKDYPDSGIVKGQAYFSWQLFKQPKQRSLTRPRQSQLTGSAKLSAVYAACETFNDAVSAAQDVEGVLEALQDLHDSIEETADEYRDSASAMEEAFPNGCPNIELCNENAESLDGFVSEIDDARAEIENFDEEADDLLDQAKDAVSHLSSPL